MLIEERKNLLDLETLSIFVGILVVIFLIVLVTIKSLSHNDISGEGITWVG